MTDYIFDRPGLIVQQAQTHDEWLALRMGFVGGSDIAAIMGVSPWATPFTVWCEKLGVSAKKDTAAMQYGRDNEERILSYAQDILGADAKVYKSPAVYMRGIMGANLDGIAVVGDIEIGIEIKTTSNRRRWDNVPYYYYLQVQHYMAVCDLSIFYLFAEGAAWQDYYIINRDETVQAQIHLAIDDFWGCVASQNPPYMPSSVDRRELAYMVAAAKAGILKSLMTDNDLSRACESYLAAQKELMATEAIVESLRVNLLVGMGQGDQALAPGFKIKSKSVETQRFDAARFKRDYPDLYAQYTKKSSYTKLSVEEFRNE